MIGDKWLSDVIFTTVSSEADISRVKKATFGDFMLGELSRAVNTDQTNDITVRAWLARAKDRKSTIVFCVDLAHVAGLTDMFRKHGIDARAVTGDTHKKLRSDRLDAFRNREFPVLVNCGVFTEGTDIPNIDCVLLARPTRSRNLLVQMIGRGMRLYGGKENCHVIDMVASLETGIVTVPTLFGLDPSELVNEATVEELKQRHERQAAVPAGYQFGGQGSLPQEKLLDSKITFTDYGSVYDLIDDTSGERHVRGLSRLAWVQVADERYVLSSQNGEYITIEKTGLSRPLYRIRYNPRIIGGLAQEGEWRPFQRTRQIAVADTFTDAVHAADTFAGETFPWYIVSKDQAWRKAPATSGQLAFLKKMKGVSERMSQDQMEQITKGKAADMITKVKFGARGRLEKMRVMQRTADRGKEKLARVAELRQREAVKVGPVAA